jgi:hypothetical protein
VEPELVSRGSASISFLLPQIAVALSLLIVPAIAVQKKPAAVHNVSLENVNTAEWRRGKISPNLLLKLQGLLDRAHTSPGEIDANHGENARKAGAAFREMRGGGEQVDERLWRALADKENEPALVMSTITEKDVAGPFIDEVPKDYREIGRPQTAELHERAQELLAEKFHMSEKLLGHLNPDAAFDRAGTQVVVDNFSARRCRGGSYGLGSMVTANGCWPTTRTMALFAIYPATVGIAKRPLPSGEFKVTSVAENPTYHYDPALNLRGLDVQEPLNLPPRPQQPGRPSMDRPLGQGLWHPWHPRSRIRSASVVPMVA